MKMKKKQTASFLNNKRLKSPNKYKNRNININNNSKKRKYMKSFI